ncbi:MAG: FxsA family protein, partial [Polyangiaceae bacterium]|nr:FxsA family protein [Polyangiaceae bacterium]
LLVTPGVLTDFVGLSLLIPPVRRLVAKRVHRHLERAVEEGTVRFYGMPRAASPRRPASNVIDVEGEVIEVDGRPPLR